jgi:hypothetical protein
MRRCILVIATCLLAYGVMAAAQVQTDSLTASQILHRVNAVWQGDSFHGIISLGISLGGQTKSHRLEVWTLGRELALIRVLEPAADLNSGYLQLGDELWYYAPSVGSIQLPSIALGDALFGAGPSLEDLSHGTLSSDYDATIVAAEDGYRLTLVPHPDAPVVYGQLEISVTDDYVIRQLVYYDQRGDVLQTATFSDVIATGDHRFPTRVVIENAYGDKTVERIENPQFDIQLDAAFFSLDTFASWGQGT